MRYSNGPFLDWPPSPIPHQAGIVHRQLSPCANPVVYIGTGNKALHDALRSMANCEGTIVFTEPRATFAPIDAFYRLYGNLTLDASGISPGITLGSDSGSYSFIFQKGGSNSFYPGINAKNINFSDNNLQRLGMTSGSHMMGALINFGHGGTAVFENCHFSRNRVAFETTGWGVVGGAIMRLQNMTYTRFEDCSVENNDFTMAASGPALGYLWIQRPIGPTLFNRCAFRNNRVTASPGVASTGVYLDSDLAQAQPVTFASCVFEGNEGTGRAEANNRGSHVCGAVCSNKDIARTALDVAFTACTFKANRVTGELSDPSVTADVNVLGAAVGLFLGATAAFTSCAFTDNAVLNTAFVPGNTVNTFRAFGGAVHLNGVTASIESGVFTGNSATGAVDARGGALGLWTRSKTVPSTTTISNTVLSSNKALATGAGARMALGGGIAAACATTAATCSLAMTLSAMESNMAMLHDSTITGATVLARAYHVHTYIYLYACYAWSKFPLLWC